MAADPRCPLRRPTISIFPRTSSGGLRKLDVESPRAAASRNPATFSGCGGAAVADLEGAVGDGGGGNFRAGEILRARAAGGRPEGCGPRDCNGGPEGSPRPPDLTLVQ